MLFAAFEKHQYYNVKELVRITNQPIVRKKICFLHEKSVLFGNQEADSFVDDIRRVTSKKF
jgi:hypothetical protein